MRYKITFSYDGSNFNGYQVQPNLRTVQGELEKATSYLNKQTYTPVVASGRTDKGVHALAQTAHFDLNINNTLYKIKRGLNSNLPDDIHIIDVEEVNDNFHARFSVKKKEYVYKINIGEYDPINRNYIYQYNKELDITSMNEAIKYFIENGYDEAYGARPLKRLVTKELETLIAKRLIDNEVKFGETLNVSVKDDKIVIL